jgi:hypothetical protein
LTVDSYEEYNKPELASALDHHLQANQSIFVNDSRLSDYYRRLTQTPRKGSPVKREPKVEVTPLAKEAPRSARRRQTRSKEESKEEVEPTYVLFLSLRSLFLLLNGARNDAHSL